MRSIGVWLICRETKKLLLQQRGKDQTNPYFYQPTWNGMVEKNERLIEAIKREAKEELGEEFANNFDYNRLVLFNVSEYQLRSNKVTGYNFVGIVSPQELSKIRLHPKEVRCLRGIDRKTLAQIKTNKETGIDPKKEIIMFEDQFLALKSLSFLKEILFFWK